MPVFLKLDMIKGESTALGHVDEIELMSLSHGLSRPMAWSPQGLESGTPTVSEVTVTKLHDRASLPLIEHALTGSEVGTARIAFARASDSKPADYLIIELPEARVSSVAMSSDGDRPVEQVTFLSPQMRWIQQLPGEDATSFGFDLGNQKSL